MRYWIGGCGMNNAAHSPQSTVRSSDAESAIGNRQSAIEHLTPNQKAWRRFKQNKPAFVSLIFFVAFAGLVLIWPFITPYQPDALSDAQFQPPSLHHWFGTDVHGRDLLTRVMYGARISLLIGAVGAAVSLGIGVLWGTIAGYAGGRTDSVLMRAVDVLYSLPNIIFVIVLLATFETPF